MRYDLEDIFSLTELTDICIYDDRLSYLWNRYMNDLGQYKSFCSTASLDVAQLACTNTWTAGSTNTDFHPTSQPACHYDERAS